MCAGCARVKGDEEEDDIDDVDNEFNFYEGEGEDSYHALTEPGFCQGHGLELSYGTSNEPDVDSPPIEFPLLTNGQMVSNTYMKCDVENYRCFITVISHHTVKVTLYGNQL